MMAYNTIQICVFTLFLLSLILTPCTSQGTKPTTEPITVANVSETTTQPIPSTTPVINITTNIVIVNKVCSLINLTADAVALNKALSGYSADIFTVIYLVSMRSNAERQVIRQQYENLYQQKLIQELKNQLSGNLRTTVVSLMLTNHEFYAKELYDAMDGLGTDDEALAEVLGTLNSSEIQDVARVYQTDYDTLLKDDIAGDTSGPFGDLLVRLCDAKRVSDNEKVHNENATQDTRELILAGFDSQLQHTNAEEEKFISLLSSRSFPHLKQVFEEYYSIKKRDIKVAIQRFPHSLKYTLNAIIQRATSKADYYADLLNYAMEGYGTNNRRLIRTIVGRSDIDLDQIKESYEQNYGRPLIDAVSDETSGDYRNLLMAILRKQSSEILETSKL